MSDNIKSEFKQMIDELEVDLKSSVTEWSENEYVTQIYHFVGGVKRTYSGIEVKTIRQGQFTKFRCKNGALVMINDANVLMVEVFEEK
jgi:hypothetical protein